MDLVLFSAPVFRFETDICTIQFDDTGIRRPVGNITVDLQSSVGFDREHPLQIDLGSFRLRSGSQDFDPDFSVGLSDFCVPFHRHPIPFRREEPNVKYLRTCFILLMALALAGFVALKIRRREDY